MNNNHELTQEEQEITDRCIRYYETNGRFMPGHRLMIIVGKLTNQLMIADAIGYDHKCLLQEVLRELHNNPHLSITLLEQIRESLDG